MSSLPDAECRALVSLILLYLSSKETKKGLCITFKAYLNKHGIFRLQNGILSTF